MNNDKHLQFIAEHLEEWPDDRYKDSGVDVDGRIVFNFYQYDFYPEGFNSKSRVFEECSKWYTREQWQEARNELLAEYVPEVGDVVDLNWLRRGHGDSNCTVNYVGDNIIVYTKNNKESVGQLNQVTITPHKPVPTLQDIMLEDWRSFNSLDESYDNMMSTARIVDVFDALVKAGWTKGEKK